MNHYYSIKNSRRPNKILILTDGDVGYLDMNNLDKFNSKKIDIYFGLFGRSTKKYINSYAKRIITF